MLQGCFEDSTYELKKYYKDPNSPAAIMMGGTYAGVVDEFDSLDECNEMKLRVEKDDRDIGYSNSLFECEEK